MSIWMIALAIRIPILTSWRLVKRARRACGQMLMQVQKDLDHMQICCDRLAKDQKLHITSLAERYENLEIRMIRTTERITKLEQTPDVKAKAAAATAVQELVKR